MTRQDPHFQSDILTEDDSSLNMPRPYHVILHNDDFTTMEFVVMILESIFHHTTEMADRLMREVHHKGQAVAGTYGYEIAETKASEAMAEARKQGFPLRCTVQPCNADDS